MATSNEVYSTLPQSILTVGSEHEQHPDRGIARAIMECFYNARGAEASSLTAFEAIEEDDYQWLHVIHDGDPPASKAQMREFMKIASSGGNSSGVQGSGMKAAMFLCASAIRTHLAKLIFWSRSPETGRIVAFSARPRSVNDPFKLVIEEVDKAWVAGVIDRLGPLERGRCTVGYSYRLSTFKQLGVSRITPQVEAYLRDMVHEKALASMTLRLAMPTTVFGPGDGKTLASEDNMIRVLKPRSAMARTNLIDSVTVTAEKVEFRAGGDPIVYDVVFEIEAWAEANKSEWGNRLVYVAGDEIGGSSDRRALSPSSLYVHVDFARGLSHAATQRATQDAVYCASRRSNAVADRLGLPMTSTLQDTASAAEASDFLASVLPGHGFEEKAYRLSYQLLFVTRARITRRGEISDGAFGSFDAVFWTAGASRLARLVATAAESLKECERSKVKGMLNRIDAWIPRGNPDELLALRTGTGSGPMPKIVFRDHDLSELPDFTPGTKCEVVAHLYTPDGPGAVVEEFTIKEASGLKATKLNKGEGYYLKVDPMRADGNVVNQEAYLRARKAGKVVSAPHVRYHLTSPQYPGQIFRLKQRVLVPILPSVETTRTRGPGETPNPGPTSRPQFQGTDPIRPWMRFESVVLWGRMEAATGIFVLNLNRPEVAMASRFREGSREARQFNDLYSTLVAHLVEQRKIIDREVGVQDGHPDNRFIADQAFDVMVHTIAGALFATPDARRLLEVTEA